MLMRDLSDFKYYSHNGQRWLAVYVTKDNVEGIAKRSGLIEPVNERNETFCFGIMALASVNQWLVIKLDQHDNRPISRSVVYPKIFERDYKYMTRRNAKRDDQ